MASTSWMELSTVLVDTVKQAAASVLRVNGGGRRNAFSGVVWSAEGVVVTASHGLDDDEVELGLPSGETSKGEVVGRDPSTDLAVVRAETGGLSPPPWSDAQFEVGQLIVSVTRPGHGPKAAIGLVSRLGDAWRTSSGGKLDRYVELDLALHAGFSGGLVVGPDGRGVGLTSAGLLRGTPLAIPVATLRRVVAALVAHGGVRRGYVGIATVPVKPPPAVDQHGAQELALLVTAVDEASPAARAGLMVGDLVLAMDGTPLERLGDLLSSLDEERIGQAARVRIARGGALQELDVTIGVRAGVPGRGRGACP